MQPWSIEDLLRVKNPVDVTVAPDGGQCVYALRTLDEDKGQYRTKLWRQSLAGSEPPVALTFGPYNDTSPKYSPDGQRLAFLSDRRFTQEDEDEADESQENKSRLYILPLSGGEAHCVGEELGQIYEFEFSPSGDSVFVIADAQKTEYDKQREKAREEEKRDFVHEERANQPRRICEVFLKEDKVVTRYARDYGLLELSVSHDGKQIVFATNYTGLDNDWDKTDLWRLVPPNETKSVGEEEELWHAQPLAIRSGACRHAQFSPDDQWISFIAPRKELTETSVSDLWVVPAAATVFRDSQKVEQEGRPELGSTGGVKLVNVTAKTDIVGDVEDYTWVGLDSFAVQLEQGLYAPLGMLSGISAVVEKQDLPTWRAFGNSQAIVRGMDVSADYKLLVFRAEDADTPFELFAAELPSGQVKRLTHLQDEWDDRARAQTRPFQWRSADGMDVEGVLVLPNSEPGAPKKWPLLVEIHGGPAWHTTRGFSQYVNWHWLAGLGYAVFAPNYRGGIGYGQEMVEGNQRDLGGGDYRDIMTGVDAVAATGLIDDQRMGVLGGSYGGYMTNWILGHETRFQAAVSEFGIWSLFTDFGCSQSRSWETMYLGRYWENESLYLERSPSRYVSKVQTPVLIVHGDADDNTF
uniref:S9 family peptidase n=1 Tax=Alicyclobacillus tolerans TaxID=90970 RepID=UPI001F397432|nr:S9 family peptidase [Alicyclobacillus tolerans]